MICVCVCLYKTLDLTLMRDTRPLSTTCILCNNDLEGGANLVVEQRYDAAPFPSFRSNDPTVPLPQTPLEQEFAKTPWILSSF